MNDLRQWIALVERATPGDVITQELHKIGLTPEQCDDGQCWVLADRIVKRLGHGEVMDAANYPVTYFHRSNPMHTWVKLDGLHYDAETPFGVTDPRDLGYFKRLSSQSPEAAHRHSTES